MDSDPISESTPKRRKMEHSSHRTYNSSDDSGDELLNDFHDTVATLPLPTSQRPPNLKSAFSNVMSQLHSSSNNHVTQPTQPLEHPRSSPSIQVPRSSPQASPQPPAKRPAPARQGVLASAMAPPGTAFRRPLGIQRAPVNEVIDLDDDENDPLADPPIHHSSESEEDVLQASIKPTAFTKGGRTSGLPVQAPKTDFSKFAYDGGQKKRTVDDMSSAYGGQARRPKPPVARQAGPARAQPIIDLTSMDDIDDPVERKKIDRLRSVCGNHVPLQDLQNALRQYRGHLEDAMNYILTQDQPLAEDLDLASSDLERNVPKTAAQVVARKSGAKQEVRVEAKSIRDKYSSTQGRPIAAKPAQQQQQQSSQEDEPKPRRRLVQGRKHPSSPALESSPLKPPGRIDRKGAITIDSADEESDEESAEEEPVHADVDERLLQFFKTCSPQDLADLANEKEEIASFILSHRPFRSLDAIRRIAMDEPAKSGKKTTRKAIGEKVLDVCEEMWAGYEAVDQLVENCEALGKPIAETMRAWGLDMLAAAKDGELGATKIEDAHDSGIGTPSSSIVEDDFVSPSKNSKKHAFLKQPTLMSTDNVVMKDYQVFGLNWLKLLWSKRLSCILADDMGLGKTCQVISFLAHLKEIGTPGVHLVVVPGSTLENWLREFGRFCPDLRVEPYYGKQSERAEQRVALEDDLDDVDVIVTTYDTAVGEGGDNKFLRKVIKPTVCVFDEGHALKNSKSKRHQQLMRIPAAFRLLLTGTPLQNNLQELASLLAFILPNLFEEKREQLESIFKYKATTKDADHAALLSAQRIARARSMMTPFILRRKKQQVLRDIPAKHRRVEYCDMVPVQQSLYEEKVQTAVEASLGEKGSKAKTSVHMMALRFAALHPLLSRRIFDNDKIKLLQTILIDHPYSEFNGNRPELVWKYLTSDLKGGDYGLHKFCAERLDYIPARFVLSKKEWMASGKVQKVKELLQAYIANGDRTLLFSQFTSMMDILESVFETLNIKFMRLDGSTDMARRQDIIDQFTADESIPVFMLSTKAGGAGINLACANKVIIFDSSFNPQEDIQAENRAHRVGQTREVEVVRLVSKGTIEEQIFALGESKMALDERVAGEGGAAAGAEDKKLEKEGEKVVEKMFLDSLLKKRDGGGGDEVKGDLSEQFRDGLRGAGLDIKDEGA